MLLSYSGWDSESLDSAIGSEAAWLWAAINAKKATGILLLGSPFFNRVLSGIAGAWVAERSLEPG